MKTRHAEGNLQVHRIVIKPSYCVQRVDDYLIVSVLWHSKRENLQAAQLTLCRKFIAHISFFVCDKIVKVNDLKFFQLPESCFCSFSIRSEIWVVRAHAELCSALLRTTRSSLNRLICWLFFNFYAIINIIGVLTKREAFFFGFHWARHSSPLVKSPTSLTSWRCWMEKAKR